MTKDHRPGNEPLSLVSLGIILLSAGTSMQVTGEMDGNEFLYNAGTVVSFSGSFLASSGFGAVGGFYGVAGIGFMGGYNNPNCCIRIFASC